MTFAPESCKEGAGIKEKTMHIEHGNDPREGRRGESGPGKSERTGLPRRSAARMFATDEQARIWLESVIWPDGPTCPSCKSKRVTDRPGQKTKMTHRCKDCRKRFSVKSVSVMRYSKISHDDWAWAIYEFSTNILGISAMHLHRELDCTHKTAWFVAHRIREARKQGALPPLEGVTGAEADETAIGGLEKNKHASKRKRVGTGWAGKEVVVGIKDRSTGQVRAEHIPTRSKEVVQEFVLRNTAEGAILFTDEAKMYRGIDRDHRTVNHGKGFYIGDDGEGTNNIENFWTDLKLSGKAIFRKRSPKHLHRYIDELTGRKNDREADTLDHMAMLAANMRGIQLPFKELTKPNGKPNHAKGAGRKSAGWHSCRRLAALLEGAMARERGDDDIPF